MNPTVPPQAPVVTPVNPLPQVPATRSATSGGNPDAPPTNNGNPPIPGIDVVVHKQPGGAITVNKTDTKGQLTFRQLAPGRYEVKLPDTLPRAGTVNMTTFVNGTPQARTIFPIGSSVGTFEVANPRDTIVLEFSTNLTPTNGTGGSGGGRITSTAPTAGGGTPPNKGAAGLDGTPYMGEISTTRLGTAPGGGPPTNKGAAGLDDVHSPFAPPSTTRLATVPGGGTGNPGRLSPKYSLPHVGVSSSGPGGVMQMLTDGNGTARLGKLPIGSTTVEVDGNQLRSAVASSGKPSPGDRQELRGGFIIPAIAILAVRQDGQPTYSLLQLPAGTIPAKIRAIVRVGRDGNVMDVDWGKGPQSVQVAGVLSGTVSGPAGPIAGALAGAKPGDVVVALDEANNLLKELSTTR